MGSFYVNYTVKVADQKAVAGAMSGRKAYVSRVNNGCVVVLDEASETQDQRVIVALARELSEKLSCAVLAVLNHDDDILWYALAENGKLVDSYDSSPGYFDPDAEPSSPAGGDAKKLCSAFGSSSDDNVERILRKSSYDDDGYVFAVERHAELTKALGIPDLAAGAGFHYVVGGDLPENFSADDFTLVS